MSTTLEAELLQAAEDGEILARMVATMGHAAEVAGVSARVRHLRQRAAWVRELEAKVALFDGMDADGCQWVLDRLTGPIPAAETAPTERTP